MEAMTIGAADALIGVLHLPPPNAAERLAQRAVVIVVGGPQYRIGSHRQFFYLAQALAASGIATLRFDYSGMGDSEGAKIDFEGAGPDIKRALDALCLRMPQVRDVVLWGLCDGASAALMYAPRDQRVAGLILVNPWVRTEQGQARARLKHYYLERLTSPELWRKVVRGDFKLRASLRSLFSSAVRASSNQPAQHAATESLPRRMERAMCAFSKPVLFVLSGRDLTAQEFLLAASGGNWPNQMRRGNVKQHLLDAANHTFASAAWRSQVEAWCLAWLKTW
jgi:exosortase A-associated hydrolase 1